LPVTVLFQDITEQVRRIKSMPVDQKRYGVFVAFMVLCLSTSGGASAFAQGLKPGGFANWNDAASNFIWSLQKGVFRPKSSEQNGRNGMINALRAADVGGQMQNLLAGFFLTQEYSRNRDNNVRNVDQCALNDPKRLYNIGRGILGLPLIP
jgi:hypothetical protein